VPARVGGRVCSTCSTTTGAGVGVLAKWTSTTYTLLLLRHLRAPRRRRECNEPWGWCGATSSWAGPTSLLLSGQTCITGIVRPCLVFDPDSDTADDVARFLLSALADGGWNCATSRGSTAPRSTRPFRLEGLPGVRASRVRPRRRRSVRGRYLMAACSVRSRLEGDRSTEAVFVPPRWYGVLRGLDHLPPGPVRLPAGRGMDLIESNGGPRHGRCRTITAALSTSPWSRPEPSRWNTLGLRYCAGRAGPDPGGNRHPVGVVPVARKPEWSRPRRERGTVVVEGNHYFRPMR
jgi:hypothetical protein